LDVPSCLAPNPAKHKLRSDVEQAFQQGKQYFHQRTDITGSELFSYVQSLAVQFGWEFGGPIAGHLIGQFPHQKIANDKVTL
jgi:hypothetical protein